MTGGEDYCLLVTISSNHFHLIQDAFQKTFERSLFPIGMITDLQEELIYQKNGKVIKMDIKILITLNNSEVKATGEFSDRAFARGCRINFLLLQPY